MIQLIIVWTALDGSSAGAMIIQVVWWLTMLVLLMNKEEVIPYHNPAYWLC